MSQNAYSNGELGIKRYNEIHIKGTLPRIIRKLRTTGMTPAEIIECDTDHLYETGLIGFKRGFNTSGNFLSRIWATDELIEMFENASFGIFDINYNNEREIILLNKWTDVEEEIVVKDEYGFDHIEVNEYKYKEWLPYEQTKETDEMRMFLGRYNKLLERSFIDIPDLEMPRIKTGKRKAKDKDGNEIYKDVWVNISHHSKFTRRIFNNGSFENGGRFYGGFWQRIKSTQRAKIRINDRPTVEIDFSGLHPTLAYARKGIDYWQDIGTDPYDIRIEAFDEMGINDPEVSREVIKKMMLLALNAGGETSLFKAFRNDFNYSFLGNMQFRFTNEQLSKILDSIKETHHLIADQFATKAGLDLMYLDSQIAEEIINYFTEENIPILTVYDSFIVPIGEEDILDSMMKAAFSMVTRKNKVNVKYNKNITMKSIFASQHIDRDFYLDTMKHISNPKSCRGYLNRLNRHNKHYANKDVQQDRPMFVPDEIIEPKNYKKYKDRQNR
ncbi:hypothetical protein N9805_05115 [Paracoccaceae bacterium]|nr:hypothetical protein [Paracoccaceae bacterium]